MTTVLFRLLTSLLYFFFKASQVASLNSSVVLLQANYVSALLHGQNLSSLLEGLSASGVRTGEDGILSLDFYFL